MQTGLLLEHVANQLSMEMRAFTTVNLGDSSRERRVEKRPRLSGLHVSSLEADAKPPQLFR
jgi:hypothetical protein